MENELRQKRVKSVAEPSNPSSFASKLALEISRTPSPDLNHAFSPDSFQRHQESASLSNETRSSSPDVPTECEPIPRLPLTYSSSFSSGKSLPLFSDDGTRGTASAWSAGALEDLFHTRGDYNDSTADVRLQNIDSGFHSEAMSRELSGRSWANTGGIQSRSRTWETQKIKVVQEASLGGDREIDKVYNTEHVEDRREIKSREGARKEIKGKEKENSAGLMPESGNSEILTKIRPVIQPVSGRTTVGVEDVPDDNSGSLSRDHTINTTGLSSSGKRKLYNTVFEHPYFRNNRGEDKDGFNFHHITSSTTTIHTVVDSNTGEVVGSEIEEVVNTSSSVVTAAGQSITMGENEDVDTYKEAVIGNDVDVDLLDPIEKLKSLPNPYSVAPTAKPFPVQDTRTQNIASAAINISNLVPNLSPNIDTTDPSAVRGLSPNRTSETVEDSVHRVELPAAISTSSQNLLETSVRISQINHTTTNNHRGTNSEDVEDTEVYSTLEIRSSTTHLYQELFQSRSRSTLGQYPSSITPANPISKFLIQSRDSIRRMRSARDRILGARSRSFLRRLRNDLEGLDQAGGMETSLSPTYTGNDMTPWANGLIELEGGEVLPGHGANPPVELDGGASMPSGPFELSVVVDPNHMWGTYGAQPHLFRRETFSRSSRTQEFICTSLFGSGFKRNRSRRKYEGLEGICKVYMQQIDERLESRMRNCELEIPDLQSRPEPLHYLVWCLGFVAANIQGRDTVEGFVTKRYKELVQSVVNGPGGTEGNLRGDLNSFTNGQPEERYLRLAHQWMLFSLETWTMLDFTSTLGGRIRQNPMSSNTFCTTPLKDMIASLLPRAHLRYDRVSTGDSSASTSATLTQIFPHEMTASMLSLLTGITFVWTDDLSSHLLLDRKSQTVSIYSNIAVAYLHTIAGDESSLNKAGLTSLHRTFSEVVESYKLLFGHAEKDRKLFREMDAENRSKGFFDIFTIPNGNGDTKPRWLYTIATQRDSPTQDHPSDFLVYGERLVGLRSLLKPKGLKGLWRDKRDTLQWWTFWAVVAIGLVSLVLAMVQTALGTIQAYASLKALQPTGGK